MTRVNYAVDNSTVNIFVVYNSRNYYYYYYAVLML